MLFGWLWHRLLIAESMPELSEFCFLLEHVEIGQFQIRKARTLVGANASGKTAMFNWNTELETGQTSGRHLSYWDSLFV